MRYPYERFLRFLVSRKVDVNQTLERYGLPRAGDIWIAETRTNLRETAPYPIVRYIDSDEPFLIATSGVLEWADGERIGPLWRMQREMGAVPAPEDLDVAFKAFVNPHSRAVIGLLLLSRATDDELLEVVRSRFDLTMARASLKMYRDIFWDIGLVSRKTWTPFINNMKTLEERNFISFGLTSPSIDEVKDLLGLETSLDHKSILNQIINKSYQQYKKAMEEPQPEAAGAMRWAELAIKAIGTSKSGGFGATETPGSLSADRFKGLFSVEPSKSNHPTLADLAGEVAVIADPSKVQSK